MSDFFMVELTKAERRIIIQALRIATEDGSIEPFATGKQLDELRQKLEEKPSPKQRREPS